MIEKKIDQMRGVPFGPETPSDIQLCSITDDSSGLKLELRSTTNATLSVTISFTKVAAFRVADESVLLTYWAKKIANTSHLVWELTDSEFLHWIENFSLRAVAIEDGIRHFIVVTESKCLEALTEAIPTIEIGG